jgi:hypothetical protein
MKILFRIFLGVSTIALLNSCIYVSTKAYMHANQSTNDLDAMAFKNKINNHYDSLNKFQKLGNDVFDDDYLNRNISISFDETGTTVSSYIEIGEASGRAKIQNENWLLYKIKKKAITAGANHIIFTQKKIYNNSGSLWHIITGRNKDATYQPTVFIFYKGKAVYRKR